MTIEIKNVNVYITKAPQEGRGDVKVISLRGNSQKITSDKDAYTVMMEALQEILSEKQESELTAHAMTES